MEAVLENVNCQVYLDSSNNNDNLVYHELSRKWSMTVITAQWHRHTFTIDQCHLAIACIALQYCRHSLIRCHPPIALDTHLHTHTRSLCYQWIAPTSSAPEMMTDLTYAVMAGYLNALIGVCRVINITIIIIIWPCHCRCGDLRYSRESLAISSVKAISDCLLLRLRWPLLDWLANEIFAIIPSVAGNYMNIYHCSMFDETMGNIGVHYNVVNCSYRMRLSMLGCAISETIVALQQVSMTMW